MVDVVVSTGAIISQDFYQVRGGRHYHGHARRRRQGAARPLHRPALRHVHRRGEVLGDGPRGLAVRRRARAARALSSRGFLALLAEQRAARQGLDPRRLRAPRRPALRAGAERLLDRHRPDRALPPRAQGRPRALPDQLDPRQLRADADRRPEPGDRGALRLGRRAEELHQRLDRDVLHLRHRHGRPQVRAADHDRRAALGRPRRLDALGGHLLGQGLQEGDARDGVRRDLRRAAAALRLRAAEERRARAQAPAATRGTATS